MRPAIQGVRMGERTLHAHSESVTLTGEHAGKNRYIITLLGRILTFAWGAGF